MNCIFPLIAEICLYFQCVVLEFNAERGTRGQMQRCVSLSAGLFRGF